MDTHTLCDMLSFIVMLSAFVTMAFKKHRHEVSLSRLYIFLV